MRQDQPSPTPTVAAPPLTPWGHTWRYLLIALFSFASWSVPASWQLSNQPWWFALDTVVGLGCFVLVWFRRSRPLLVAWITAIAATFSLLSAGPAALALLSLATRRRWREIVPLAAANVISIVVVGVVDPTQDNTYANYVIFTAIATASVMAIVAWGLYVGSRRELLANLRERAVRAEADRAEHAVRARNSERTRIAREMHDVLAHRISLVTMHADAMVFREDLDADGLRRSAKVIQESSHRALRELREVLGVLRDDPGDAQPEPPQPGAVDIGVLIAEATGNGARVDWFTDLDLAAVPESAGRTLYRAVQECLTNVRKHAGGALLTLRLTGGPEDGLTLRAANPQGFGQATPAPASGFGLIGLAERASLAGGQVRHHESPGGEFVLTMWLPWPP